MIKIFVILLLCGIISGAEDEMKSNDPQNKLFPKVKDLFKKPLLLGRPLARLKKRNSESADTQSSATLPFEGFLAKLRKTIEENRSKQALRPARALKYYFNIAAPDGGCGCGNGGQKGGGSNRANCKCDNKKNDRDTGKQ